MTRLVKPQILIQAFKQAVLQEQSIIEIAKS